MKLSLLATFFFLVMVTMACGMGAQPPSQPSPSPVVQPTATLVTTQAAVPNNPSNPNRVYELLNGDCTQAECLFRTEYESEGDYPVGVATLQGYSAMGEPGSGGEGNPVCDSFVILGGSKVLNESILALVNSGNSVYRKNELDQPIINLDFSQIDDLEKAQILSSSLTIPVDLTVLALPPSHQGAPACFTRFEIIKVQGIIK